MKYFVTAIGAVIGLVLSLLAMSMLAVPLFFLPFYFSLKFNLPVLNEIAACLLLVVIPVVTFLVTRATWRYANRKFP